MRCQRQNLVRLCLPPVVGGMLAVLPGPPAAGTPATEAVARPWAEVQDRALEARLRVSTVAIRCGQLDGSGVIVGSDGLTLTAAHVISDETAVCLARLSDGSLWPARVLQVDRDVDCAVLRIAAGLPLEPARAGDSEAIHPGQAVIAVGHGGAARSSRDPRVRRGHVMTPDGMDPGRGKVLTDVDLEPGDSGGPLFDRKGRLVGMNLMESSGGGRSFGVHRLIQLGPAGHRGQARAAGLLTAP